MTTPARRRLGRCCSLVLLIGLALSAGCAWRSAPTRFYVLAGVPRSTAAARSAEPGRGPTLGVGPVTLPGYLERANIVTRRGEELDVADFDRWGEPLSDSVPRAIAASLAMLLGTERIIIFPWPGATTIDHQIVVDMVRFDGVLGADVLLEARWRVLGPERKELVLRYSMVREPTGQSGYPALVAAMSRSLGVLSGEIADAVKALRASSACRGTVACARGAHGSGGRSPRDDEELRDPARTPSVLAGSAAMRSTLRPS